MQSRPNAVYANGLKEQKFNLVNYEYDTRAVAHLIC